MMQVPVVVSATGTAAPVVMGPPAMMPSAGMYPPQPATAAAPVYVPPVNMYATVNLGQEPAVGKPAKC